MKTIALQNGKVALVDDQDYEHLIQFRWFAAESKSGKWYVRRNKPGGNWIGRQVYMHRQLLDGSLVDHVDGNGLNNQRANLRIADKQKNGWNRAAQSGGSSKYKGVHWYSPRNKWLARFNKKYLGLFDSEIDAALAYNAAALKFAGEFARLNIVEGA
jgi:AP2 domain